MGPSRISARHAELKERLRKFGVTLSEDWLFDVFAALQTRPLTILGRPR
jgi:hypothetical protein